MCDLIPANWGERTHYYPYLPEEIPMKYWILAAIFLVLAVPAVSSAESSARKGQRLFAGCVKKVDDKETLKTGQFVCKGKRDPAPFGGNGRACGDCHMPGDNFGISVDRIARLKSDHPLFFRGLDEDQKLLRRSRSRTCHRSGSDRRVSSVSEARSFAGAMRQARKLRFAGLARRSRDQPMCVFNSGH